MIFGQQNKPTSGFMVTFWLSRKLHFLNKAIYFPLAEMLLLWACNLFCKLLWNCTYMFRPLIKRTEFCMHHFSMSIIHAICFGSLVVIYVLLFLLLHEGRTEHITHAHTFTHSLYPSTFCVDSHSSIRSTRVTSVAHKRSWSFCQRCRWQVTAKHACTLCMWICMKWRNMVRGRIVYTEHAKMAAALCGTSHLTTIQHCNHFSGYSKHAV